MADDDAAGRFERMVARAPTVATRRPRRVIARAAAVVGGLALAGLIAALIVAAPSDHGGAPAGFDGTMRVSLLDRPPTDADHLASVPPLIDPGSVRFGTGDDIVDCYAGRGLGDPDSVCLIENTDDRVIAPACGTVPGLATAGLVATDVGVGFPTGTPDPVDPPGVPSVPEDPVIRGTLAAAAAAMPFAVLAPDPPPLSGDMWVFYARDDPRLTPQVTIDYLPAGAGPGASLIEAAEGSTPVGDVPERRITRGARTYFLSGKGGPPVERRLRVVRDGTDVRISGSSLPLDQLLDVADSLRPAAP